MDSSISATGHRKKSQEDHPEFKRATTTGGAAQDANQRLFLAYAFERMILAAAREFSLTNNFL
jgi:hypothetical protein